MPTVLLLGGARAVVYPNDHRPAHVHVIAVDREAVFNLRCPAGPVELRENFGFRRRDIAEIRATLNSNLTLLCANWSRIHGEI